MKYIILIILLVSSYTLFALDPEIKQRAFLVKAKINQGVAEFNWDNDDDVIDVIIRKKKLEDKKFEILDVVSGEKKYFFDNYETGKVYEYSFIKRIKKQINDNDIDTLLSYSYFSMGEEIAPKHFQGSILLLVDSLFYDNYEDKVLRLKYDLVGEGWKVHLIEVPRTQFTNKQSVMHVKNIIKSYYELDNQLKSIFLLGRVAVPYSGVMAPDGHGDHVGAWPSDLYYGEIDGLWTDTTFHAPQIVNERNHNLPDDGKFDNNLIPSDVDLSVGRVDMYDLPVFEENEQELLSYYLDKDHEYRHGLINVNDSAIVNDRFGIDYSEAFAAGGLMNFYALFNDRVNTDDYLREVLKNNGRSYKWFYGCGPGSYTSAYDIAYSQEFAESEHNAVFSMIFGSYHGDWDSRNNVLRSAIASKPSILTSAWSGRPTWFFHRMLFGETIGEAAKFSQNYSFDIYPSMAIWGDRVVHIALMGDPTLRHHIVQPIKNLKLKQISSFEIKLTWEHDLNASYYVYRSNGIDGTFELLNKTATNNLSYIDANPFKGKNVYMVRVKKLEEHHLGSYYNLSTGIFAEINFALPQLAKIYPNPAADKINVFFDVESDAELLIYDSYGREVNSVHIHNNKGYIFKVIELKNINGSALSQGKYFLRLKTEKISENFSFIIIK